MNKLNADEGSDGHTYGSGGGAVADPNSNASGRGGFYNSNGGILSMSSIKLTADSGGGTFEIKAPLVLVMKYKSINSSLIQQSYYSY